MVGVSVVDLGLLLYVVNSVVICVIDVVYIGCVLLF